jgi:hypothetical protein
VTKPAAIDSKLTQVLFSCGKTGLLASSDFSRIARPFIEWAWRLESHPLKGQLRAAVCQHVPSYLEYMTTSFAESEIYNRVRQKLAYAVPGFASPVNGPADHTMDEIISTRHRFCVVHSRRGGWLDFLRLQRQLPLTDSKYPRALISLCRDASF